VALGVAGLGALGAVRRALRLPPAVAMRPEPPPAFVRRGRGSAQGRLGVDSLTRLVLRRLVRAPLRATMTTFGVAAAGALLIGSLHWIDSIDALIVSHFERTERFDLRLAFAGLENDEALEAVRALPGVLRAEPTRTVAAELSAGLRKHRGAIDGLAAGGELMVVRDVERGTFAPTPGGLIIAAELARKLGVDAGDPVEVAFLEGRRPTVALPVAAVIETYLGTPAYLALDRLNALAGDGDVVDGAILRIDTAREAELFAALKASAAIAGVSSKTAAMASFDETLAETIHFIVGFYVAFAGLVAFGVVYTGARITLSERARELASLRVLGFTRGEISYILLGELALVTVAALPVGAGLGWLLALGMGEAFANELYRVPFVIRPRTFGIALTTVLAATAVAALAVRHRLDHLDLVAVLKTRE
jgi:putative ABC transport system permease protein